ncbi:MAG: diphosphate--fructose-6-phosphate 1-phosphotransferase [Desulfobacterales bacterium]|nr:diphosphate--fructose-6-phosphate 1-phosphotransferase [Pseudomonadota bacterium]MBU4355922.1 diphosphate--fructose-6-phosphate 1-phosphotransferase [Pseudomonadota bacterium]MCG2770833.1 diphosphate--fructose-6-phosphate 1-phosphotransferase [Desulfobacterales bacterium]
MAGKPRQTKIEALLGNETALRAARRSYQPHLCPRLAAGIGSTRPLPGFALDVIRVAREQLPFVSKNELVEIVPDSQPRPGKIIRLGVVLSGGPAPGGHNVIAGLFQAAKRAHPDNQVIGFLAGPKGIITDKHVEITADMVSNHLNSGGFHMLGTGRDKIDTPQKMKQCRETCAVLKLSGLVVVGGDDSNTNAAFLAENLRGIGTQVIGIPKTIDGDLQVPGLLQIPFGFHSACMAFATEVGNLNSDCKSDLKYWHFNRLMGRSASHIAMEVAFQTHPNVILIGEEIEEKELTIHNVVRLIADVIVDRAREGKNYGTILIPEGILEFIHEVNVLIIKISYIIAAYNREASEDESFHKLSYEEQVQLIDNNDIWRDYDSRVFLGFPGLLQKGLLLPRDSHGNFPFSLVNTERILLEMVATYLRKQKAKSIYKGTLRTQNHYYGYDGRGTFPTKFDCDYGYNLGFAAYSLLANGATGYMAAIKDLHLPVTDWHPIGIPLAPLMHLEERKGRLELVIAKQKVDLESPAFKLLEQERQKWSLEDQYRFPGPIQFDGPAADTKPITLQLNSL